MAVAVKNAPVAAGASPFDRMPVVSLVGAAYVLGCLAIALWAVPTLWNMAGLTPALQSVFDYWGPGSQLIICLLILTAATAIGFVAFRVPLQALSEKKHDAPSLEHRSLRYLQRWMIVAAVVVGFVGLLQIAGGDILLLGVEVGVVIALAYLGYRLLGSHPPVGTRAGIFVGMVALILILLLTRWVSLWLEYSIYGHGLGDSPTVGLLVTGILFLALIAGLIYLFLRPETEKYLLLLEGQGWFSGTAYKGLQGQRVRRGTILGLLLIAGSGIWTMWNNGLLHRLPQNWLLNIPFTGVVAVDDPGDAAVVLKGLPAPVKDQVKIVSAGGTTLKPGSVVSQATYRDALKTSIQASADLSDEGKDRLKKDADTRDISELLNLSASPTIDAPAGLPAAALLVDQYTLRDANERLRREYVRVSNRGLAQQLTKGQVLGKEEFNKIANDPIFNGVEAQPTAAVPFAAVGSPSYRSLTLLPSVQFLLPALLLVGSLWLAWRVVNYPPFADFLIATEAELNKVSWTTRSRLIQDTIVVLVTVVLMAVFLFSMDQLWHFTLSWKQIGVLQINDEQSDKNKSAEQKPW